LDPQTVAGTTAKHRVARRPAAPSSCDAGALSAPDDVWLLTFDELRRGLEDPRTLAGVGFDERRREFERARRVTAPRITTSDGYVPPVSSTPVSAVDLDAGGRLQGTGAAPGVVEGTVRVIMDPGTERLTRGDVLVAPYTDPGWTPLFVNAAAVVTEVGGRLTHGSLVAREYGIPAVVAVDGATTRLTTGERVRVDGTSGTVERLE
jgi:pyruvate,water dikinase